MSVGERVFAFIIVGVGVGNIVFILYRTANVAQEVCR